LTKPLFPFVVLAARLFYDDSGQAALLARQKESDFIEEELQYAASAK
jgi:hypothetical protein